MAFQSATVVRSCLFVNRTFCFWVAPLVVRTVCRVWSLLLFVRLPYLPAVSLVCLLLFSSSISIFIVVFVGHWSGSYSDISTYRSDLFGSAGESTVSLWDRSVGCMNNTSRLCSPAAVRLFAVFADISGGRFVVRIELCLLLWLFPL